ncbi:hypothetical protein BCR35DRAFT_334425 [Leucosporidium creatinivorum]|uniref:Uncharacterized protein n=1 Tax=Leucosporidium creatinivorum TaxID=106004 RepID=A0A1Y2E925_9BASI|nr:hypothetical protein BCR35DRAFT_334425 [Leucosporidium creatinivorum]
MANQLFTKRNVTLSLGGLVSLAAGAYKFLDSYFAPHLRSLRDEVDRVQRQSEREMNYRLLQMSAETSHRLLDTKQDIDRRFLLMETSIERSIARIEKELLRMKLSGKPEEKELDAELERGGESEKEG